MLEVYVITSRVWTSSWRRFDEGRGVSRYTDCVELTESSALQIVGDWEGAEKVSSIPALFLLSWGCRVTVGLLLSFVENMDK